MTSSCISTEDPSYLRYTPILGADMAYVDVGHGDPGGFRHVNPTQAENL